MGLLTLLISFVFFAGVAMTVNEGLWSNTITILLIIISAVIAIPWGYFAGGVMVVAAQPSEEYAWAFFFAGVWGVFALSMTILRFIADRLSKVRMRFHPLLDKLGGSLVGFGVATLYSSFVALTLVLLPIEAGVWKAEDGTPFQQKSMTRSAAPLYTALKKFYGGEFANLVESDPQG
jgi:hypothetical protein